MKKILVTGGIGYIGSHTVVELVQKGFLPIIVDDLRNSDRLIIQGLKNLIQDRFVHYALDVCDKAALFKVFEEHHIQSIIHFAAYKSVNESVANPLGYYQNNLNGLMNVLEACEKYQVKQLVFSSSCTVYGEPKTAQVFESTPKQLPVTPYGYTKWMGEQILSDYAKAFPHFSVVCLRYFNPVGAHPSSEIGELPKGAPNNLLPYITQTAAHKRPILTVFGQDYGTPDGTCIRDYIHVCDVADAHVLALELDEEHGVSYFNVGTGKGTSVMEMVQCFESVAQQKLNYQIGSRRTGDISEIYANVDHIKNKLGWVAKRSIEDAILDAWNWEKKTIVHAH